MSAWTRAVWEAVPAGDMALPRHGASGTDGALPAYTPLVLTARVILWGLVVAQLADALTFTIGVSRFGIDLESNSFVVLLFGAAGLPGVLIFKGVVLLATIGLLVATSARFPRLLVWGGAAATSLGVLGFATNALTITILS
jgi:hypothetical protein